MEKMVDIRDEHGNPIQLTDGDGYPVLLTDEYGNPMRLIGVATRLATTLGSLMLGGELGSVSEDDRGFASYAKGAAAWPGGGRGNSEREHNVRSTTSGSSSSEEEDEHGGRRKKKKDKKKKGLTQKIREKFTSGKHKDNHSQTPPSTPTPAVANKNTAKTAMERKHPDEHEKKGVAAPP